MARGRRPARKMARGGRARPAPRGRGKQMARGGRSAPKGRGRKMASGGSCGGAGQMPCGGAMRRGGRPTPRGRGRKMAAGGGPRRTAGVRRQNPRGPQGGCNPGEMLLADGSCVPQGDASMPGMGIMQGMASMAITEGIQQRKGGRTRPAARGRGRQMARGGRTRPTPRRGGRQMARGGRAPARRFQGGGSGGVECPAGSFKTADGRCTQMGS